MDSAKLIDRLGGTSEVAKLCECSPQEVTQWFGADPDTGVHRTIPKARLMYLQAVKPEVFAALAAEEEKAARKSRAPVQKTNLARPTANGNRESGRARERRRERRRRFRRSTDGFVEWRGALHRTVVRAPAPRVHGLAKLSAALPKTALKAKARGPERSEPRALNS